MKKFIILSLVLICIFLFSIVAYANYANTIEATKKHFPIAIDGVTVEQNFTMLLFEDRIYLPLRTMCNILNVGIDWEDEGRVEISTTRNDESHHNYQISEKMATEIADIIFAEKFGRKFVESTKVSVDTTVDAYKIYRYLEPPILGGDATIYISKKDGRIIDIIAGE